ncbi:pneumococcal-type histidine triad protein [Streptococcus suis]
MKKKAVVGSVAALVLGMSLCSYQLGRFQAMEEQKNRVSYIEDSQSVQTTVAEQLTPDQVSAKENIDAEQIVVKITDQGYVTSHGDHFHYYNGKVPFDAIFSEELVMKDSNYVLQDSHILNEVKDGYVIKVDGKYYLYLKDPSKRKSVRSKEEVERQKGISSADSKNQAAGNSKDSHYRTDDGYVFNPTDVIEDTGDGFIVPHGSHFHFVPKKDLSASELATAQAYWDRKIGRTGAAFQPLSPQAQPVPISPQLGAGGEQGSGQEASLSQLLAELTAQPLSKRYQEADGLVFDPRTIVKKTAQGVVVPHGDHFHFIPYSQLSELELRIVAMMGQLQPEPSQPQPSQPSPLPQPNQPLQPQPEESSQPPKQDEKEDHHEAVFDASQVVSGDGEGYVVKHDDHTHYFYKKDLTKEQIEAAEVTLAAGQSIDQAGEAPIAKGLSVEDFSRDAEDQEKMEYIAKTYGIPLEAVKANDVYLVFNNPDHAYDPTHIHPYAVLKKNVRIPLVTGDETIDFLNELYTTALRSGLSPYRIKVEKNLFVIPHSDHNHYIRIQTPHADAIVQQLPMITGNYQAGDYAEAEVLAKVDQLLADSARLLKDKPAKHRQVQFILGQFTETLSSLASNSTAGYLQALDQFAQQFIYEKEVSQLSQETAFSKKYNELVKQVELLSFDKLAISKQGFLKTMQEASQSEDMAVLEKAERFLEALVAFQKRPGIEGIDYMRYFYEHVQDGRLSDQTRQAVAETLIMIFQSQIESHKKDKVEEQLQAILDLKDRVKEEIKGRDFVYSGTDTLLDQTLSGDKTYSEQVGRFLDGYYGIQKLANQNQQAQAVKERLMGLMPRLRKVENREVRQRLADLITHFYHEAYKPSTDFASLLAEVQETEAILQHPERIGKPNSQIIYTDEEVAAAKAAGCYTTSDGYIFDAADITADEGDAYIIPHMGHSHWVPKADLSEEERAAAALVAKEKGLVPPSLDDKEAEQDTPKEKEETTEPANPAETVLSTRELYEKVAAQKIVPVELMPYHTAYTVAYRDGRLVIPHHDHYHNIALAWFDEELYQAPEGYSMEDFLATVKYYIEHPEDRPGSDDGWGDASEHGKPKPAVPAEDLDSDEDQEEELEEETEESDEEIISEETEEIDEFTEELKRRAEEFGMDFENFERSLFTLSDRYKVSFEAFEYDAISKVVRLVDKDGVKRTISLPSLEEQV